MFNVGPEKLMVVLLVALIVLGPDKLPNAARQVGKFLAEFRRISSGFQTELRSAMDITDVPAQDESADPVDVANAVVADRVDPDAEPVITSDEEEPEATPGTDGPAAHEVDPADGRGPELETVLIPPSPAREASRPQPG
jgi:Tat protein translocase TatB subunit